MSQPTEETPLLGAVLPPQPPLPPPSKWYILPYALLLLLFLFCNLLAIIPLPRVFPALPSEELITLQLCLLMVADYIVEIPWLPLAHVAEYAASVVLDCRPEQSERKTIRKSESLNAFFKAFALKIPPIISTIVLASRQLGFLFILLAVIYLAITCGFTFVLVASARMVQDRKAERDNAL